MNHLSEFSPVEIDTAAKFIFDKYSVVGDIWYAFAALENDPDIKE